MRHFSALLAFCTILFFAEYLIHNIQSTRTINLPNMAHFIFFFVCLFYHYYKMKFLFSYIKFSMSLCGYLLSFNPLIPQHSPIPPFQFSSPHSPHAVWVQLNRNQNIMCFYLLIKIAKKKKINKFKMTMNDIATNHSIVFPFGPFHLLLDTTTTYGNG